MRAGTALAAVPGRITMSRIKRAWCMARLARQVVTGITEVPGSTIRAMVRACSPIQDPGERMKAWALYLDAYEAEHRICEGVIGWRDIDDELTCPERTAVAIDIACQRTAERLAVLLGDES